MTYVITLEVEAGGQELKISYKKRWLQTTKKQANYLSLCFKFCCIAFFKNILVILELTKTEEMNRNESIF